MSEAAIVKEMNISGTTSSKKNFKDALRVSALKLVLEMGSEMNVPRSLVYETVRNFTVFISTIIRGITTVITPHVTDQVKVIVTKFISEIESSFTELNTEDKLEKLLVENDLTNEFEVCDVLSECMSSDDDSDLESEDESNRSESEETDFTSSGAIGQNVSDSSDGDDDANEDVNVTRPTTTILLPISFQLKTFFELPNVFQKVITNTRNIQSQGRLNHFISGKLWKQKLRNYADNDIVIPYHFYVDGAQLNNPQGPHTAKGLENSSLFHETHVKKAGFNNIFSYVIEELSKLAEDGIVLNIGSQEIKVFFVCGLFLGD
ncbi:hypothetical protein Bhyg_12212 [Pseudolycoriella hygida]|uniref:Uncharacterized protein n=1 Tax=Pseudolycoriella hygida TaxID=35572 RepID=A0A9Q0S082_9DIPT|nr:hypothetical protein Bhyg_12212 [Pseudolycoriella hygida]